MLNKILHSFSEIFSTNEEKVAPPVTSGFEDLSLYYRATCPFCRYVMSFMKANDIVLDMRNITAGQHHLEELVRHGGKRQVPCLRIAQADGDKWLYESADIAEYLQKRREQHS